MAPTTVSAPIACFSNIFVRTVYEGMVKSLSLERLLVFWQNAEIQMDGFSLSGKYALEHVLRMDNFTPLSFCYCMLREIAAVVGSNPTDYLSFWAECMHSEPPLARKLSIVLAHDELFLEKGKEYEPVWSMMRHTEGMKPLGEVETIEHEERKEGGFMTFAVTFDRYYRRYDAPEGWKDFAPITGLMPLVYGVHPLTRYHMFAELARKPSCPWEWVLEGRLPFHEALHVLGFSLRNMAPPNWEVSLWSRAVAGDAPERCIYGAPAYICRYYIPCAGRISSRKHQWSASEVNSGSRSVETVTAQLRRRLRKQRTFRFVEADSSVYVDNRFLTSGIQGRILRFLLEQCLSYGRCEFERRELTAQPQLITSAEDTGLSVRLSRIRKCLEEKGDGIRLVSVGRGRFRLDGVENAVLETV